MRRFLMWFFVCFANGRGAREREIVTELGNECSEQITLTQWTDRLKQSGSNGPWKLKLKWNFLRRSAEFWILWRTYWALGSGGRGVVEFFPIGHFSIWIGSWNRFDYRFCDDLIDHFQWHLAKLKNRGKLIVWNALYWNMKISLTYWKIYRNYKNQLISQDWFFNYRLFQTDFQSRSIF